jgi:trans-2,3-dihydro-3-hydroxyanthranilate isomerase
MTHNLYMVDVFAERRYTGNPLAVIIGDQSLSAETMQAIATEINFSETTFVEPVPEANGGYRTRIFTPAREIAFAGHPILGTAWVLRHLHGEKSSLQIRLNLSLGQVPATFEPIGNGRELTWFRAPETSFGPKIDAVTVAGALGVEPSDVDTRSPIQVVSSGTSAIIVPLRSLDALQRSKLNLDAFAMLAAEGFPPLIYLFCREVRQGGNDFSARFFFEAHGVREDPATGNGAAFLGAYLLRYGVVSKSNASLRIEQGHEIGRPSLVQLHARVCDGKSEVKVGGHVIPTVKGELILSTSPL